MLFWLAILGVYMGWVEAVCGGDKSSERSSPTSVSEERQELFGADTKVIGEVPLPEPPGMFRAEPAVKEAELVIQGRSISSAIPGRVIR